MPSIKLQSGDTAHYTYDPQRDQLTVRLRDDPARIDESIHPQLRRAHVRRDADTGEIVGLRVSGVQELILEAVVRDLVGQLAPPEPTVAVDEQVPGDARPAESPRDDAPGEGGDGSEGDGEPREKKRKKKRRRGRRKKRDAAGDKKRDVPGDETRDEPGDETRDGTGDETRDGTGDESRDLAGDLAGDEPRVGPVDEPVDAPVDEPPQAAVYAVDEPSSGPLEEPDELPEGPADHAVASGQAADGADGAYDAGDAEPLAHDSGDAGDAADQAEPDAPETAEAPQDSDVPDVAEPDSLDTAGASDVPDVAELPAPDTGVDPPEDFAFLGLRPKLGQAIADMGFTELTPIQRRAVPEAMSGRDMVGLAQTGTGKTLAFLIPGLQRLLDNPDPKHRPRLLVVTPVRELAVQVAEQAELLASRTDLRVVTVYGGANMRTQSSALKRGVDVIVATPGRLLDHLRRRNADLSSVEVLVLDEADRMLDMGFLPDVREILHNTPAERQTLLFGATMPPAIESLSLQFQRDPVLIEIARQLPPEGIEQLLYPVGKHLKVPLLVHLLSHDQTLERVLVFAERRTEADLVSRRLRDAGLEVAAMHGDIRQSERERALERLRDGKVQVLVATNVAARGLDVEGISHVVNYDIPQTVDDYIHRIGRTARADAIGKAYTFIAPGDQWMVKRIESALERELPRVEAEGFDYDVPTPSWAQPSPDEVARTLDQPKSAADISRRMRPR